MMLKLLQRPGESHCDKSTFTQPAFLGQEQVRRGRTVAPWRGVRVHLPRRLAATAGTLRNSAFERAHVTHTIPTHTPTSRRFSRQSPRPAGRGLCLFRSLQAAGVTARPSALPSSADPVARKATAPWRARCGPAGLRAASWRCRRRTSLSASRPTGRRR
jgi:hypothetical protein